jgi:sulfoxide reductase heme-binding subunit YedZ
VQQAGSTQRNQRQSPLSRRTRRRLRHHVLLAGIAGALVAAIAGAFSAPLLLRVSGATAYASLLLLAITLLLGPAIVLLRRPNPVSTDLRRDLGIWAAILGITHTVLALWRPVQGAIWRAFVAPDGVRLDSREFANDVGLAATLLLMLLLGLSNDWSLRRLGSRRWKAAQRFSYLLFAAAVVHTLLYQQLVEPGPLFVFLLPVLVAAVLALQIGGWIERRQQRRPR